MLRRIAAMKFAEVVKIDSSNRRCLPVNVGGNWLTLVWLPETAIQQQPPEDDPDDYSSAPLESVEALLAEACTRELRQHANDEAEFEWWLGGAVLKGAKKPIDRAIEAVSNDVFQRLQNGKKLQFVYDVVPTSRPFHALHFTLDAGRKPLRVVAEEVFQDEYGLPRTLSFKKAVPRETQPSDLWSTLY